MSAAAWTLQDPARVNRLVADARAEGVLEGIERGRAFGFAEGRRDAEALRDLIQERLTASCDAGLLDPAAVAASIGGVDEARASLWASVHGPDAVRMPTEAPKHRPAPTPKPPAARPQPRPSLPMKSPSKSPKGQHPTSHHCRDLHPQSSVRGDIIYDDEGVGFCTLCRLVVWRPES